jgi:hypothetical protein
MKLEDFNLRNLSIWIIKLVLWIYLFRFAYTVVYGFAGLCDGGYEHWNILEWSGYSSDSLSSNISDYGVYEGLIRSGFATNMALLISACLATFMLHGLNHYCKWDKISKLFKRKSDNKG